MKNVKYRFYLDYEKEEAWINEMAAQGWHLEKFSVGRFTFKKGEPGAFIYRNEFLSGMQVSEREEYLEFLADSNVTIVHTFGGWIYMKRATADGPFRIYTDKKSKISYYKRMLNVWLLFFAINILFGMMNVFEFSGGFGRMNLAIGSLNIAVSLLLLYPLIKVYQRKKSLEKQQIFFE